jgi:hypothetical protein
MFSLRKRSVKFILNDIMDIQKERWAFYPMALTTSFRMAFRSFELIFFFAFGLGFIPISPPIFSDSELNVATLRPCQQNVTKQ